MQYIDKEKIPERTFEVIDYSENTDYSKVKPVDDNIFKIYKEPVSFTIRQHLTSKIEETDQELIRTRPLRKLLLMLLTGTIE